MIRSHWHYMYVFLNRCLLPRTSACQLSGTVWNIASLHVEEMLLRVIRSAFTSVQQTVSRSVPTHGRNITDIDSISFHLCSANSFYKLSYIWKKCCWQWLHLLKHQFNKLSVSRSVPTHGRNITDIDSISFHLCSANSFYKLRYIWKKCCWQWLHLLNHQFNKLSVSASFPTHGRNIADSDSICCAFDPCLLIINSQI